MKKRWYVLLAAALLIACFAYIAVRGDVYVLRFNTSQMADPHAVLEQKEEILRIAEEHTEGDELVVTVRSVSRGHAYVDILDGDEIHIGSSLFVHPFGIITEENYFGDCTGGICLPIAVSLFLLVLLIDLARQYRAGMRRSLYQYRNVRTLALIIYLAPLLLTQVIGIFRYHGLEGAMRSLLSNGSVFANFAFPVAFVLSILVTLSNLRLMRREGRTWRNMLGCILGVLLLLSTLFPAALGEYLQRSTLVDVHNERGRALYVELAVEDGVLVLVSYLECVLLATIALTVKAARHVPAFDKDCILILGCQIKKDGTLTNLLRGRADRALDFARIQAEATGKALTFVPSGGQGADEVCSEGEAIRRYLLEQGVEDARILAETESASTFENLRNSAALIRARFGDDAKIAFSTTNYHVFRAGVLAMEQGVDAEGIGSPTKSYFWINAFIREFIATMVSERKTHIAAIAALILTVIVMAFIVYLSAVL